MRKEKFFDGIRYHRVVHGFVIQAGVEVCNRLEDHGFEIVSEFSRHHLNRLQ
ncbi:MAG: peptidylprolyl isomerase [Ignavibacteriales bacterium]|nr:peptidylprolyl isomerase [Ignavibacteriales bacterium]